MENTALCPVQFRGLVVLEKMWACGSRCAVAASFRYVCQSTALYDSCGFIFSSLHLLSCFPSLSLRPLMHLDHCWGLGTEMVLLHNRKPQKIQALNFPCFHALNRDSSHGWLPHWYEVLWTLNSLTNSMQRLKSDLLCSQLEKIHCAGPFLSYIDSTEAAVLLSAVHLTGTLAFCCILVSTLSSQSCPDSPLLSH